MNTELLEFELLNAKDKGAIARHALLALVKENQTIRSDFIIKSFIEGRSRVDIAKDLGLKPRSINIHIMRIGKNLGIDCTKYHLLIRLLYIEAKKRGLLSAAITSQLELT